MSPKPTTAFKLTGGWTQTSAHHCFCVLLFYASAIGGAVFYLIWSSRRDGLSMALFGAFLLLMACSFVLGYIEERRLDQQDEFFANGERNVRDEKPFSQD